MKKRTNILIGIILIGSLIFVLLVPYRWSFVFFEQRTSNPVAYLPLNDQKTFQIRYTHSIHLSDVLETYNITKDYQIQISSLEYEDFAIGMPSDAGEGEKFTKKDGKYIISNMSHIFPSIDMLIGDINKVLAFNYNVNEYDLKKYLVRGETYTFQVARLSLIDQLRGARIRE
ncbi:MAG: DUF1850 domain-containing protein [Paenisporosarcina sp.]